MSEPINPQNLRTTHLVLPWVTGEGGGDSPFSFDLYQLFSAKDELVLGRNPASDLWVDHPAVSRTHASLRLGTDGQVIVRDLGSTHGVALDGNPVIGETVWKPGTLMHLGPVALWLEEGTGLTVTTRRGAPNLEARGLTVEVPGREQPILDGVSFTFQPGQFVCVLGPSGAGKSTLVRCLQGLQPTSAGSLEFGGNPILSNPTILNGLVGYAPQRMSLHESLTARQVVWYAAKLRLPTDTTDGEIGEHVDGALDAMAIRHLADQKVALLSGGERKRVELASELVVNPAILLVDEATSSLDPASESRVMEVLARTASQGRLVLCVTHHLDNVSKADKLLILGQGKCLYLGPPEGACAHFGVENLADAFVRIEDEGPDRWVHNSQEKSRATNTTLTKGAAYRATLAIPRRGLVTRIRETFRQTGILSRREFASTWGDRRYLFLVTLMPVLFALILFAGHWLANFSSEVLLTRKLNEDEKSTFRVFWPLVHDAAKGNLSEEEFLTLRAQLAFLMENRPAMRKELAGENLDRIVQGAIDGDLDIFPSRFIKNHMSTLKYLAVQMMGLSFMGMLLGLTLMVRDGDIFPREKAAGIFSLSYLLSKLWILVVATLLQTLLFDGLLEIFFLVRQPINGLAPVPAEYRIGFVPMLVVHWMATFGCACLGVLLGTLTRKADRAIILLGAMMLPQLILGSALGLAAAPVPRVAAFLTSPTYWGLRATQVSPIENGVLMLPTYLQTFGAHFIQSVPLALAGLAGQIILYLLLAWLVLFRSPTSTQGNE